MSLSPGTRIGAYEVVEPLGAGGMGEVYRARDSRLKRDVALKILPKAFAGDPERMKRFEREAQVLASLNHPHIAAIHGIEEGALVLELVEGPTLAERVSDGRLPVEEALGVARQIAEGLEAAHEKNVVHRDLKPANVKLTPEGAVKILDFGLAKALGEDPLDAESSNSPTMTRAATAAGVLLGTAAYMSPEQARGKPVDKRADIWAFGCVLYEMLAGKRLFEGDTVSDTLAAVLRQEIDWQALPSETPAPMRKLLERCLDREAKTRLRDIGEARIEIARQLESPTAEEHPAASPLSRHALTPWLTLAVGALAAFLAARLLGPEPVTDEVIRLTMPLTPAERLPLPYLTQVAITPDGETIAFVGGTEAGDETRIYLRRIDSFDAVAVPGTEGGISPFFSPDGRWLGFLVEDTLKKVPLDGGPAVTVSESRTGVAEGPSSIGWTRQPFTGVHWGDGDRIVFSGFNGNIYRVSAQGGAPEAITQTDADNGEFSHRLPHLLPGGNAILYTVSKTPGGNLGEVVVQSLATGERRVLVDDASDARLVASEYLVFVRDATLYAARFDLTRLELLGPPVPVLEGVQNAINSNSPGWNTGAAQYAVSLNGTLVYAAGGMYTRPMTSLAWVDREGNVDTFGEEKTDYFGPKLSPDGRRIVVAAGGRPLEPWIYDLERDSLSRPLGTDQCVFPLWTPDGEHILFASTMNGPQNLYRMSVDGSGELEQLTTGPLAHWPSSISPDGKRLLYVETHPEGGNDLWMLSLEDGGAELILRTPGDDSYPMFSPDGAWIAYSSNFSGRAEVYVQPFPGPGARVQISTRGGRSPLWSRDGRELFYWQVGLSEGSSQLMRVPVVSTASENDGFQAGAPQRLMDSPVQGTPVRATDISLDGKRFLTSRLVPGEKRALPEIRELRVVVGWSSELARLVP